MCVWGVGVRERLAMRQILITTSFETLMSLGTSGHHLTAI
ncbi:hypothetical protein LSH36_119g12000 [Paralvinella palmiformis]|uniref:Uncharacterized protein n=1 Tax=Paralvinella palmiformis TaxID=53620 RepID=A0AAD9JYC6_9ANNE|nr:hypothetical protein LSH36_119g12000 [Paralvinella palmiformis]